MSVVTRLLRSLLESPWFQPKKVKQARLIVLGLDAAGKTTLLYKLKCGTRNEVVTTIPTIGFNIETLEIEHTQLRCWDVGGCDKIRPLWRHYTSEMSALVFVVDSNDVERFSQAKEELNIFLTDDTCKDVPLLVIANKQDLFGAKSLTEVVSAMGLAEITNRLWYAQATSCINGIGIKPCFEWLESALSGKPLPPNLPGVLCPNPAAILECPAIPIFQPSILSAGEFERLSTEEAWSQEQDALRRDMERRDSAVQAWLAREDTPLATFVAMADAHAFDSWDHYTHVRLAWAAIRLHGLEGGFAKVEEWVSGFIRTNPERTGGKSYHRTLTRFWAHMIASFMIEHHREGGSCDPDDFKRFLAAHFADHRTTGPGTHKARDLTSPALPRLFFSNAVLFSPEARQGLVRPDLAPLPEDLFVEYWDSEPFTPAPYFGHGHRCGRPGCPAGGTVLFPETFARDRAWFRAADYYRQKGGAPP